MLKGKRSICFGRVIFAGLSVGIAACTLAACSLVEKDLHGDEHLKAWESERQRGAMAAKGGDFATAEGYYNRSVQEAAYCPDSENRTAISLRETAEMQLVQSKFKEAEATSHRALAAFEKLRVTKMDPTGRAITPSNKLAIDDDYAKALATLANVLREQNDLAAAEPLYKKAIQISDTALAAPVGINRIRQDYARMLRNAKRDKEAL